jgi:hypothetical protein
LLPAFTGRSAGIVKDKTNQKPPAWLPPSKKMTTFLLIVLLGGRLPSTMAGYSLARREPEMQGSSQASALALFARRWDAVLLNEGTRQ